VSHSFLVLAQAAAPGLQWIFLGLMVVVGYFLLIRPQQKQIREHRTLISSLKKGDDVVTQGGILGKIHAVSEREVQLEVASGVRIRVLKTSIQGKRASTEEGAAPAEEKKDKEERK
jgi:preprotein translocase subunit YajC